MCCCGLMLGDGEPSAVYFDDVKKMPPGTMELSFYTLIKTDEERQDAVTTRR